MGAFLFGGKMKHYKNWGTVSSGAELHMLARAERTRKKIERKKKRGSQKRKHKQDKAV